MDKIIKTLNDMSDDDLLLTHAISKNLLKKREIVRTSNIVGEIGEKRAIEFYNNTAGLPNLQFAPETTQNVDALSRRGDRYSIKAVTYPAKTTGVFWGLMTPKELEEGQTDNPKFEFLVIVVLNEYMQLKELYEMAWNSFIEKKRWHSRMNAWNISISGHVKEACIKRL